MKKAIGIDLGGTNLRVAVVNHDGKILKKHKAPSDGDVIEKIKSAISELNPKSFDGIGIGVAGLIDSENKKIIMSPNLPILNGQGFSGLDHKHKIVIENDANAAAMGEKWMGAGREYSRFVLLTLGTGIGGGVVHEGKLLSIPAEAGHMSIVAEGAKCPCGNIGCLELYASARAIAGNAMKAIEQGEKSLLKECCQGNIYKITPEDIYSCAFEGDGLARDVLKKAGRHLGVGIANLINLFAPEAVILTGGLIGAWDIYIDEAIKEASKRSFKALFERVKILPSALGGEDAGILGAAGLILNADRNS